MSQSEEKIKTDQDQTLTMSFGEIVITNLIIEDLRNLTNKESIRKYIEKHRCDCDYLLSKYINIVNHKRKTNLNNEEGKRWNSRLPLLKFSDFQIENYPT
jgi:hypothetical protein